jgi:hypothetical protein
MTNQLGLLKRLRTSQFFWTDVKWCNKHHHMARPKGNRKEARLSVSLDERVYAALRALAHRNDVSVAWMVRHAVHELIQHNRKPELPRIQRVSRPKQATP